jgi:hypothetical protein
MGNALALGDARGCVVEGGLTRCPKIERNLLGDATTRDKDLRQDEIDLLPAWFDPPPIGGRCRKRQPAFGSIFEVFGQADEHTVRRTNEVPAVQLA